MKHLVKLKDIASYSKGSQINGDELIEGAKYYYLNGGINPSGKWSEANCEANTITISEGGNSCGYVNYMRVPFWCGAHCYFLYDTVDNTQYLYYALKSQQDRIMKLRSGACMPNIKKGDLGNFEFFFDKDEAVQEKVTTVLGKLENIIDSRKKELSSLDDLIKARFVELFGNCKEKCKLSEYAELITKGASPRWQGVEYSDNEEGTLFVTSENVREGFIDYSKRKYLPNEINDILPRSVLKRNDVLINIVNASIGRAAIYESDDLANINQAVALVRLKPDSLNLKFLLAFLNSDEAIRTYNCMKVGGDKANLSLKNISDLQIPVADMSVQNQFADFTKQVDKSKVAVQKALDETQVLFDSLMQKYFG